MASGEKRIANSGSDASFIYHPSVLDLATNVQFVKGIGPKIAQILLEKGISTVEDLLYYLPFRYEDRLNPRGIGELRAGEMASIIAEVRTFGLFRTRRMPIFEMTVGQGRDTLEVHLVQRHLSAGQVSRRHAAGALRQGGSPTAVAIASKSSSRSSKSCTIPLQPKARPQAMSRSGNRSRWGASSPSTKPPATVV